MNRALLAILLTLAASPAWAASAVTRFRGTVERADGDHLTIRRSGGSTVTMRMDPRTRIYTVLGARVRDIKPESYVSVLSGTGPEPLRATGVTLYSPSERGFEAGRQPWDHARGASLTAGWVAGIDPGKPMRVTLNFDGGRAVFSVPDDTSVTQMAPGEKALLVPGAAVTAFAQSAADGTLEAGTVAVGRQGAVPNL